MIWQALWRWACKRHPSKGRRWVMANYFTTLEGRKYCFQARNTVKGTLVEDNLFCASTLKIVWHTKIRQSATPFDLLYNSYFEERTSSKWKISRQGKTNVMSLWKKQIGCCPICLEKITKQTNWFVHWLKSKLEGGASTIDNMVLLHPHCYRQGLGNGFVYSLPV